jgi:hypothetical protein
MLLSRHTRRRELINCSVLRRRGRLRRARSNCTDILAEVIQIAALWILQA